MTLQDKPTSASFPDGLPTLRSEAEVRALRQPPKPCPFCGEDPGPARQIHSRFQVGCESDDCFVCPQVGGGTLAEAWFRWNARPKPPAKIIDFPLNQQELEAAGCGGIK